MPVDDERSEDSASTEVVTPGVGASGARKSSLRRAAESATGSIWLLKWYRADPTYE